MPQQQLPGLPSIAVEDHRSLAVPLAELRTTLAFLAHRTGRPVRLAAASGQLHYNPAVVVVYPRAPDPDHSLEDPDSITVGGRRLLLAAPQRAHGWRPRDGRLVCDERSLPLAGVDHNCIVLLVGLLYANNEAARYGFPYALEKAIPFLDFDVADECAGRDEAMRQEVGIFLSSASRARLEGKRAELRELEGQAEHAYYTLVNAERSKPLVAAELEALQRQPSGPAADLADQQARALRGLLDGGLYQEVSCCADGSLTARTGEIVIHHEGYEFPLGPYLIAMDTRGQITVRNLDPHEGASRPHPHVSSDLRPCLGNAAADLAKAVGMMRIAEALQVLHEFLCSYNPQDAYESIARFDSSGEYRDEPEDPCEDCDLAYTPDCILDCEHNQGLFFCPDCCHYRMEFCFTGCGPNSDYSLVHPCQDCRDARSLYCYLECPHNQSWELQAPCAECQQECSDSCQFRERSEELDHATRTSSAPA